MSSRSKPLNVKQVEAIKLPGSHSVGGNLILMVGQAGARWWVARITDAMKKRRDIGLGNYPETGLADARDSVSAMKRRVRSGLSPKLDLADPKQGPMPTFKSCALSVHEGRKGTLSEGKHVQQWLTTLEDHAFAHIGSLAIDGVTTKHVIDLLKPIWTLKPETAKRVLQRVATVIAWATANEYRDHELAVASVRIGLPPRNQRVIHHSAIPWQQAPDAYQAIKGAADTMSGACLQFVFLTLCRSNEARSAQWGEIDLNQKIWTVPAERMKKRLEHKVPLSKEAVQLVSRLEQARFSEFIFPNRKGEALTDVAITKALRRAGRLESVHGLRSSFRDWFGETTNLNQQIAKAVIGQAVGDGLETTYFRSTLLKKRVPVMQKWANFLKAEKKDAARPSGTYLA